MENYPEELRTPPMPLVAVVGVPELHPTISSYLHMEQLPINTLALPDFTKVAVIGGKERKPADARLPPPVGILKIDWLWKHRTRVPAALVVLLSRDQVYGDPAQWLQVCTDLDNIKTVLRGRNTKLVIVVVQPALSNGDVVEDRLMALRKRAEVDAKHFLTLIMQESPEQKRSLARLGIILAELVNSFYKEEGRRVKIRLEKKTFSSTELGVRYNFKVAVYAEFRREWMEALRFYETAYTILQEIVTTPIELQLVQRLVELKAVAEQVHFKVSTLQLHGGKEVEAVRWFKQHIAFYKGLVGPSEGNFIHWSWVSKQFLVFGDLLQNSLTKGAMPTQSGSPGLAESPVTGREFQPGYYYQVAACYVIERRRSFESVSTMFDAFEGEPMIDVLEGSPEEVGPPLYVGQASRVLGRGTSIDAQCPTEKEYMYHAVKQERTFPYSSAVIDLLKKAYEQYKLIQAGRMVYCVASEMGREYYNAREYANAKQLFDTVAGMYRKEAWVTLLWATLGFLRECARQLNLLREYIEYSLEMAALPTSLDLKVSGHKYEGGFGREVGPSGPLSHTQREQVFKEVFELLQGKHTVLPAREGETGLMVIDSDPVALNIDVASPLRAVLAVCVAFHEQMVKPGTRTFLTLSLLTRLPQMLELDELELHFNQSSCDLILHRSNRGVTCEDNVQTVATGGAKGEYDLKLEPNRWKRFSFDITPGQSGKLECLTVTARLGKFSSISCQVESPAFWDEVLFWKFESQLEMSPMRDSCLSSFGQKTIQVEEPQPLVDVVLEASGPGLPGEYFPVVIAVRSEGHAVHAGEMQISIAESSTMSIISSPKTPPVSGDSSLVELYTVGPASREGDGQRIQDFQKFSGTLAVPAIATKNSWSTKLYLKWNKANPASLYVSFGYHSEIIPLVATRSYQFFVHKGLQLECEEPFTLKHRYMAPFRRDALLVRGMTKGKGSQIETLCIPLDETSTLMLNIRNSSSVELKLLSIEIIEANRSVCSVRAMSSADTKSDSSNAIDIDRELTRPSMDTSTTSGKHQSIVLRPGETFMKLFFVHPMEISPSLTVGTVSVEWQRLQSGKLRNAASNMHLGELHESDASQSHRAQTTVRTNISLPAVQVEKSPLLVTFHCPPYVVLGVPFVVSLGLENFTPLIQEVNFSIVDSPSFILSGAHSDTIYVIPHSKDVISYKLVAIASGQQQLPQFNLTAVRYNAGFQQSLSSIQLFVFPSPYLKPHSFHAPHSNIGSTLKVSEVM